MARRKVTTRIRRVFVRTRRRARKAHEKAAHYLTHHPLGVAAIGAGVGGTMYLVGNPLPNGDGLIPRISYGISNPSNPLAIDEYGNNVLSIGGAQIMDNVWATLPTFIAAGVLAYADRKVHVKG